MSKPEKKRAGLTGVGFSIEAALDNGFSNFRILMLFIVDGELIHVEKSQPYATYEALAKTELILSGSIWNLSTRFKDGRIQSLGGDTRDELVNRLKKTNPQLLVRISPALGLA